MPQYKNSTAAPIVVGSFRVEGHETKSTNRILRTLPTGLTLISTDPQESFNVASSASYAGDIITANAVITIPADVKWQITIACTAGSVAVHKNDGTTETVLVPAGKCIKFFVDGETVDNITLDYQANSSVVQVDVIQEAQVDVNWFATS